MPEKVSKLWYNILHEKATLQKAELESCQNNEVGSRHSFFCLFHELWFSCSSHAVVVLTGNTDYRTVYKNI